MAQPVAPNGDAEAPHTATDHTLAHMVEELEEMEGARAQMSWVRWAVLAFSVVLVVAMGIWMFKSPKGGLVGVPVLGGGVQMSITAPAYGKQTDPPKTFSWQAVDGRDHYVLSIGTFPGKGDVLEKKVAQDQVELTQDEVNRFSANTPYWWTVKAVAKDGRVLGRGESKFMM